MRIAKRHIFAYKVVGKICRGGKAAQCRLQHDLCVGLDVGYHTNERCEAVTEGIHGVKQRLLILLVVFIVRQWLTFH